MTWRAGALLAAMLWAGAAGGQSLAHKGWAGNGIVVAPWWQGAVFYVLRPEDLQTGEDGLAKQMDGLRELGVDALVLEGQAQGSDGAFEVLVGEATRRRLRVVVDLPVQSGATGAELASGAQYWLSRGAAGLRLVQAGGNESSAVAPGNRAGEVERLVAGFSGQRVLLWDLPGAALKDAAPVRVRRRSRRVAPVSHDVAERVVVDHWMQGWPLLDAGGLRRVLAAEIASVGGAALRPRLIDAGSVRAALARAGGADAAAEKRAAAAVMLGAEAPLLYAGEEGSNELAKWYGLLGAIRHGSAAVHEGGMELLNAGDANVVAWVRMARAGGVVSPPTVVVENFSDRAVTLQLGAELRRAGVKVGSGVLLVSAQAGDGEQAGTARVDGLTIGAGGVFVGSLEGAPGLEAAPEPVRRKRR